MKSVQTFLQNRIDIGKCSLKPALMGKLTDILQLVIFQSFLQPLFWKWIAHGKMVKTQNCFLNLFLTSTGTVALYKPKKPLCRLCMCFLQKLVHHICLKHLHFTLICHPKSGIKTDFIKIIFDDKEAEGIDCGDQGVVNQRGLLLQMLVLWMFLQFFRDCFTDSLPHLSSSRRGKRHDQEPVDINRMTVICNHLDDTLNKHCGLPASRCC